MLAQTIPGKEHCFDCDHGMINFVTGRNDLEESEEQANACYDNEIEVEFTNDGKSSIHQDNLFIKDKL